MKPVEFRIGTRGSKLALAQANLVKDLLAKNGVKTELKIIKTSGDTFTDRPLHEVKGFGVFVREIDDAMLAGEIDIAVHSMKDVPTERPPELTIAAVMKRDSPYDFLLTREGNRLKDLLQGAVVGTTSLRRRAQLLRIRPDLTIKDLRGNIDTRLRKLKKGQYDGIFLAEAGLERMKWALPGERLNPDDFVPSANQGTVVIVTKKDSDAEEAVRVLDDEKTRLETRIERIIIGILGGGCLVPIGAFAQMHADKIRVRTEVLSVDGKRHVKIDEFINPAEYEQEAKRIGNELYQKGGGELVDEAVKMFEARRKNMTGKVYLVGSGPGDPELLTIKAKRLIESAEVILYDQLPGKAILNMLPDSAERIDVGKYAGKHELSQWQINELLVNRAKEGHIVVRLKGGDPYLFGRGGEEAQALARECVEVEVVPGITSAIAVPAYAGIPVTH
ncbi:MAG: hydroxymethylbilane synthase, partial [Euryarchaeota archaeon]|nr:hydroxymethylbilane synthase [Euryarchaeota archaeon]